MIRKIGKCSHSIYYIIYTFVFMLLFAFVFSPFFMRGNSLISRGDGFHQFLPVFSYIGSVLRQLFGEGTLRQFDFSIGLGESVIAALNVHGMGNIFTLISAFANRDNLVTVYSLVPLLELYFCGITFSIYCFAHKKDYANVLVGAISYVFTMYTLVQGIHYYTFLYPVVILPLMALGIDQLLENRKRVKTSSLLIFTIAILAFSGFYFLYMETFFLIIYFIVGFFSRNKRGTKLVIKFTKTGLWLGLNYMIGIMMASIFLLPSILGFLSSSRNEISKIGLLDLFVFEQKEIYISYIKNLIIPQGYEVGLGLPIAAVFAIVVLYCVKTKEVQTKVLFTLSLVGVFIPLVGYATNGFAYYIDRWIFILYFFSAYAIVVTLNDYREIDTKVSLITISIMLLSVVISIIFEKGSKDAVMRGIYYASMILAFLLLFLCMKKNVVHEKVWNGFLVLFILGNVCLNGLVINGPRAVGGTGWGSDFMSPDEIINSYQGSMTESIQDKDEEFYRIDINPQAIDEAQVLDYNGTFAYYSIMNKYVSEYYEKMGLSPLYRVSNVLYGLDGRKEQESVLSVKYYEDKQSQLVYNKSMLPLGFTYPQYISEDEFNSLSVLERNELLTKAVVISGDVKSENIMKATPVYHNQEIDCKIELNNIKKENSTITVNENSYINVFINEEKNKGDIYLCLRNLCNKGDTYHSIYVEGKEITSRFGEYMEEIWINIGKSGDLNPICIRFTGDGEYQLEEIETFLINNETFYDDIIELKESILQDVVVGNNEIQGSVCLDEDGLLFLSVPYSSGWKVYVDGIERTYLRANVAFMAIELEQGEHYIELKYCTPGIMSGAILSVIGVFVFIMLFIWGNKNEKQDRK